MSTPVLLSQEHEVKGILPNGVVGDPSHGLIAECSPVGTYTELQAAATESSSLPYSH